MTGAGGAGQEMTGAGAGQEMTGAGAGQEMTGAGAGQEMTGAGAGQEMTGAGAGHAMTGAGAGHGAGQETTGAWQHGPNLLDRYRCLADTLESNPASKMMISGASAIKMEYLVLLVIIYLH